MYPNPTPIPIETKCQACTLSNGRAVSGHGPEDLSQVKLIVVSDYPGAYETEFGWPQVPNAWVLAQRKKQQRLAPISNSGGFLRATLEKLFGLDTFTQVWMTNAFRCDPNFEGRKGKPTERQLGQCATQWNRAEFAQLDLACPQVPILAAGSWALKLIRVIYRDQAPLGSIDNLLRVPGLFAGTHPLVCTYNPATYARSQAQLETAVSVNRRSHLCEIKSVQPLADYLYSPINLYEGDLKELEQFLAVS